MIGCSAAFFKTPRHLHDPKALMVGYTTYQILVIVVQTKVVFH